MGNINQMDDDPGLKTPAPPGPPPLPTPTTAQAAIITALRNRGALGLESLIKLVAAKDQAGLAAAKIQIAQDAAETQKNENAGLAIAGVVAAAVNVIPVVGQIASGVIAIGIALAKVFIAIGGAKAENGASFTAAERIGGANNSPFRFPSYRGFTSFVFYGQSEAATQPLNAHPEVLLAFQAKVNTVLARLTGLLGFDVSVGFPEWGQLHGGYTAELKAGPNGPDFLNNGTWDKAGPTLYLIEALDPLQPPGELPPGTPPPPKDPQLPPLPPADFTQPSADNAWHYYESAYALGLARQPVTRPGLPEVTEWFEYFFDLGYAEGEANLPRRTRAEIAAIFAQAQRDRPRLPNEPRPRNPRPRWQERSDPRGSPGDKLGDLAKVAGALLGMPGGLQPQAGLPLPVPTLPPAPAPVPPPAPAVPPPPPAAMPVPSAGGEGAAVVMAVVAVGALASLALALSLRRKRRRSP